MAKTVSIRGISYDGVGSVSVPLTDGSGDAVFYDSSDATIDEGKVLKGYTAYGDGGKITGIQTIPIVTFDTSDRSMTIV